MSSTQHATLMAWIPAFAGMTQMKNTDFISTLTFNADGLIPTIAQQHDTGEVLMLAWMNKASLQKTLETGNAT